MQERYLDARELLLEALRLDIRRGDRRNGSEAVHGLAATAAGLGDHELCVRLDRIQRELCAAAGIVQRVATVEAERRDSTLDAALELVEAGPRTSVASAPSALRL